VQPYGHLVLRLAAEAESKQRVADACNEAVRLNRQIDVRVLPREEALAIPNIIRTESDLLPPDIEMVRIVDINGIDIQADGGPTLPPRP
jgi:misacylated tRNA(Ala) deacylase